MDIKAWTSWRQAIVQDLNDLDTSAGNNVWRSSQSFDILKLWVALRLCEQAQLLRSGWDVNDLPAVVAELKIQGITLPSSWVRAMPPGLPSLQRWQQWAQAQQLSVESLAHLHEQALGKKRQKTGVFYTPGAIVQQMVTQSFCAGLGQDGQRLQILDPACGAGLFLSAILRYWFHHCSSPETAEALDKTLLGQLYGIDVDPEAIAIAQLILKLQWALHQATFHARKLHQTLQPIEFSQAVNQRIPEAAQLKVGNSLLSLPEHWHLEQFDVVIGNPPFIDAEKMTGQHRSLRQYCNQHYETAQGNWDLFCVFIERSLQLCRPGGLVSLVVPNKLATAPYAAAARSLLLRETELLGIWNYAEGRSFSQAAVYPLVFLARKRRTVSTALRQTVPYAVPKAIDPCSTCHLVGDRPWLLGGSEVQQRIAQQVLKFPPLADQVTVVGAATVAEAYALQPLLREQPYPQPGDLRMVNSGTIQRDRLNWGIKPMRYLGQRYQHPIVPAELISDLPVRRQHQARSPKLIVSGLSRSIVAALDVTGECLAGKSTTLLLGGIDLLRYTIAVLHSAVLNHYVQLQFSGNQLSGGYLCLGPPQLRSIPIPTFDEAPSGLPRQLAELQEQRSQVNDSDPKHQELTLEIERLVCELYQLSDRDAQIALNL